MKTTFIDVLWGSITGLLKDLISLINIFWNIYQRAEKALRYIWQNKVEVVISLFLEVWKTHVESMLFQNLILFQNLNIPFLNIPFKVIRKLLREP